MALINAKPWTFRPKGLSDAIDGSSAFKGAMSVLQNLVPSPGNDNQFVPRPAAVQLNNFSGYNGTINALLVIGTKAWGMVPSTTIAGHDEPFCYDLAAAAFIPIVNVTGANTPVSPSPTGDWTPPTVVASTNGRLTFTHPGYENENVVGWIDISSYSADFISGNTVSGSAVVQSIQDGITSAPSIDGVMVGQLVNGAGIPADTYVVDYSDGTFDLDTTCTTDGTVNLTAVGELAGVEIGMNVAGIGFAPGTWVVDLPGGGDVTLNIAALNSVDGTAITFSGGGTITLSNEATADASLVALTLTGGTPAAPLYGAGQTAINPLAGVATCAGVFNGRTWYGVGNAAVYSDPLNPQQITLEEQALKLGDNVPVTAMVGQPFVNTVTGGAVQALIVFKGAEAFFQITGDAATNDLAQNLVNGSVGTLAPNSICATTRGLAFIAPDGLRVLQPTGTLTDPVGRAGQGVHDPLIDAINPSRMCAGFNNNVVRISCQPAAGSELPVEFFYDFDRNVWTGPHTFPSALIQPYVGAAGGTGFISAPSNLLVGSTTFVGLLDANNQPLLDANGQPLGEAVSSGAPTGLWLSYTEPNVGSTYTENGLALSCVFQPTLLPDNQSMSMNAMVETNLAVAIPAGSMITVLVTDEAGLELDQEVLSGTAAAATIWDAFAWGSAPWGGPVSAFRQVQIPWALPLVFKQCTLRFATAAAPGLIFGDIPLKYQPLGYNIPPALVA